MKSPDEVPGFDEQSINDRIDLVCDAFEKAWLGGEQPRIEDYLSAKLSADERPRLLRELLIAELELRRKTDKALPSSDEYRKRFPEAVSVVEEVFQSVAKPDGDVAELFAPTILTGMGSADAGRHSKVGDYELLHEIARGGMGVVYKARHTKLGRLAAVKLIRSGDLAGEEEVRRFYAEAEAASQLDHPGIVPLFEAGQENGQHYLAMAFVDGPSLWQKVKEQPLEPREAARVMQQVAEAVQHAHERGIIHRDLKPQNILMTSTGQARVTDFGLAKQMATDSSLTATGQVMGTPSYMPPEQASGSVKELDQRADVYSLGATLYCLLTGRPPFQAATLTETLRQVAEQDPVSLRLLNSSIPVELEAICSKCLAKSREHRYGSCRELGEDLERFLKGEPVSVSILNWSGKLRRAVQRNRDDVHLRTYSVMLAWFAAIVLLAEVVIQCLDRKTGMTPYLITRAVQLLSFVLVVIRFRRDIIGVGHPAISQMWGLWLGFFVACHIDVWARLQQHWILLPDRPIDQYTCYPTFFVLSGFLFVALGRQYWGMCYVFGVGFFSVAIVLPWLADWSPIIFGTAWGGTLAAISWRLRTFLAAERDESFQSSVG